MKKLWIIPLLSVLFICIATPMNADDAREMAGMQELPQSVQTFLHKHFPETAINKIYLKNWGEYKVKLADGVQIEFDKGGDWKDIESDRNRALPQSVVSLLPQAARDYIAKGFPDARIYEMEKEKYGYEVKLHGREKTDLYFDANGNFLQQKDND